MNCQIQKKVVRASKLIKTKYITIFFQIIGKQCFVLCNLQQYFIGLSSEYILGNPKQPFIAGTPSPRKLWARPFIPLDSLFALYVYLSAQHLLLDISIPRHGAVIFRSRVFCYLLRNVEWLMHGSLLCISLDGFFEEPVWAVVEKHFADERFVTKRGEFFLETIIVSFNPSCALRGQSIIL